MWYLAFGSQILGLLYGSDLCARNSVWSLLGCGWFCWAIVIQDLGLRRIVKFVMRRLVVCELVRLLNVVGYISGFGFGCLVFLCIDFVTY